MDNVIRTSFAAQTRAAPPREIAFLADYGAPLEILLRAGEIAEALGVEPDVALLNEGLAQEEFFYRALADRLGLPFHVGGEPLDTVVSPARAINVGVVYLARLGAPYRVIAAPRGRALSLLMAAAGQRERLSAIAITSPRRLGALVRVQRAGEIAKRAATHLALLDPALSARSEMAPAQTFAAAAFGFGMIGLAITAPWAERAVSSLLLWLLFSATIVLRFAAAIAAGEPPPAPDLTDAQLPVFTVIVAMHRESEVIPKLVAALNAFDYPVLCSKLT